MYLGVSSRAIQSFRWRPGERMSVQITNIGSRLRIILLPPLTILCFCKITSSEFRCTCAAASQSIIYLPSKHIRWDYHNCVILQINNRSDIVMGLCCQRRKQTLKVDVFATMSLVEKYSNWESILYLAICIYNQIVTVTFLYEINIIECI